jgi:hypothetical protein
MATCHDLDLDVMPPSGFGEHLLALLVRSFSTTSRPACGRPPQAAVLGRQPRGTMEIGSALAILGSASVTKPMLERLLLGRTFDYLGDGYQHSSERWLYSARQHSESA